MARVLVCGSRYATEDVPVFSYLDSIAEEVEFIITGGADGVDSFAYRWAVMNGIPLGVFPAHWTAFGRAAGPKRNAWMLQFGHPQIVVAFPGGKGTENMMAQAKREGILVRKVGW